VLRKRTIRSPPYKLLCDAKSQRQDIYDLPSGNKISQVTEPFLLGFAMDGPYVRLPTAVFRSIVLHRIELSTDGITSRINVRVQPVVDRVGEMQRLSWTGKSMFSNANIIFGAIWKE
jgi:hypothetical protein